jgi:hypothetical protein
LLKLALALVLVAGCDFLKPATAPGVKSVAAAAGAQGAVAALVMTALATTLTAVVGTTAPMLDRGRRGL